jgi:hypothetical protein
MDPASAIALRFPKTWAMISSADGTIVLPKLLRKVLLRQFGVEVGPEIDDGAALGSLLEKLEVAAASKSSAPRNRWKLLRSALVQDAASEAAHASAAAVSVRRMDSFGLLSRATCGRIFKSDPPICTIERVHTAEEFRDLVLGFTTALASTLVWSCLEVSLLEEFATAAGLQLAQFNQSTETAAIPEGCAHKKHAWYAFAPAPVCMLTVREVRSAVPAVGCCVLTTVPVDTRPTLAQLVSHRASSTHGVDNTGNVCVWPSEEVLGLLVASRGRWDVSGKTVIELGGGMTGTCECDGNTRFK